MNNLNSKNYIQNSSLNLADILDKAKKGNDDATLTLVNKYRNIILKYSSTYHLKNYEKEDLIQIGTLAVIQAINKYNSSKGFNHIDAYIINSIKNSYKHLARSNIRYGNESSLNITISNDGDEGTDIQSLIADDFDLEYHILNNMKIKKLNSILSQLSDYEKELLKIAYFNPNCSFYHYCKIHTLNYTNKRRELIKLIDYIKSFPLG